MRLYCDEFEEDFPVSALGNPSGLSNTIGDDDAGAELVGPPPEDVTLTLGRRQKKQQGPSRRWAHDHGSTTTVDAVPPNQQAMVHYRTRRKSQNNSHRLIDRRLARNGDIWTPRISLCSR